MEELCGVLHSLVVDNPSASVWIAGDVNLIGEQTLCVGTTIVMLSMMFVDFLNCNGFVQSVDSPTRNQSILDIFCANRPSLVSCCQILPGISDHEAVLVKTLTVLMHDISLATDIDTL